MERRNFITALVAVPTLGLLAACGSDAPDDSPQTSDTAGSTTPEATAALSPESGDIPPSTEAPNSSDASTEAESPATSASVEPVLSYTTPGGFTTNQLAFQDPPIALLTQDGTLLTSGIAPDVFPQPLLPHHSTQTVSPAGTAALLAAADAAGLFADVDYTSDDRLLIADAPTTVLTITAERTTYTHEAAALGAGGAPGAQVSESTPERQALLDFVTALRDDPASIFGADNLGESTAYEPGAYQFTAMSVAGADIPEEATIGQWPADAGIELSMATECVEVERELFGDLFETATQLTFFEQDGQTYQVTPRPAYPGRSC